MDTIAIWMDTEWGYYETARGSRDVVSMTNVNDIMDRQMKLFRHHLMKQLENRVVTGFVKGKRDFTYLWCCHLL